MIRHKTKKGILTVHIEGHMLIRNAVEMKSELMSCLAQKNEVELNLSLVNEIDIAGLQLLILAKKEASLHQFNVRLVEHSNAVIEIFDLCNLSAFFGDPLMLSSSKAIPQASSA